MVRTSWTVDLPTELSTPPKPPDSPYCTVSIPSPPSASPGRHVARSPLTPKLLLRPSAKPPIWIHSIVAHSPPPQPPDLAIFAAPKPPQPPKPPKWTHAAVAHPPSLSAQPDLHCCVVPPMRFTFTPLYSFSHIRMFDEMPDWIVLLMLDDMPDWTVLSSNYQLSLMCLNAIPPYNQHNVGFLIALMCVCSILLHHLLDWNIHVYNPLLSSCMFKFGKVTTIFEEVFFLWQILMAIPQTASNSFGDCNFGLLGSPCLDPTLSVICLVSVVLKTSPNPTRMSCHKVEYIASLASKGTNARIFVASFYVLSINNNVHMDITPWAITFILSANSTSQQLHLQVGPVVGRDRWVDSTLFSMGLSSISIVKAFDLEDKIIFRGVGNDTIHSVWAPCLVTKILDIGGCIDDIKAAEVKNPRKTEYYPNGGLAHDVLKSMKRATIVGIEKEEQPWDPGEQFQMSKPYWQVSLSGVKYNKLNKRYYGPFRVIERIGSVAYKLELPSNTKIYNVFHCSLLKLHFGPTPLVVDYLPPDSIDNHPILTPLAIVDSRTVTANGQPQQQVLVQWQGLPPDDTYWDDCDEFQKLYNLEDKVEFEEVGIDTVAIMGQGGGSSNVQPNPIAPRPTRVKKTPSKYNDHLLYK